MQPVSHIAISGSNIIVGSSNRTAGQVSKIQEGANLFRKVVDSSLRG